MIELRHVTKAFNGRMAVDDISFNISQGQIFGFLGPTDTRQWTSLGVG